MIGRFRAVGIAAVCLVVVTVAPVTDAQVMSATPGQSPALNVSGGLLGPYTPPTCVPGVPFSDITCTTGFDPWIEQFGLDGITAGCGGGKYCPGTPVTRDQMAVFIEKSMRGTANWPAHMQLVWAVKNSDGTRNPTASGTALINALTSIPSSGNDAPSASNPWLLKIGPGVFDVGTFMLTQPAYVSMEGSGIATTIVQGGTSSQLIQCYGNAEISSLSVSNVGTGGNAQGLWISGSMRLTKVSVSASGATNINSAVVTAPGSGTHTFNNVELNGTGAATWNRGLEHQGDMVIVRGGTLTGSGSLGSAGVTIFGGTAQVFDAIVSAPIPVQQFAGSVSLAGSQLLGGSVGGTVTCAGVYDAIFGFYANTCP